MSGRGVFVTVGTGGVLVGVSGDVAVGMTVDVGVVTAEGAQAENRISPITVHERNCFLILMTPLLSSNRALRQTSDLYTNVERRSKLVS